MNKKQLERLENLAPMIGDTPLLEITYTYKGEERRIFAKPEGANLTGSVKDRIAYYILKKNYEEGTIKEGDVIAEATSGNTGIAFSALGSYLGHEVIIFMPDWMSAERISLMESFGATVHLVSREEGGFLGSIAMTEKLAEKGGVFLPRQFSNEDNTEAHIMTTGKEILEQLARLSLIPDGGIAGVGTGGTVMGLARSFASVNENAKVYALEPESSPTLSTGNKVGNHRIYGISDEFVPPICHLDELAGIIAVDDGDAICMSRMLSENLALSVGISSGANFLGAVNVQNEIGSDSVVVTIFSDDSKKYLSTDYAKKQIPVAGSISADIKLISVKAHK